jgi:membrane-bound lytic murein transglycosylase B
VFASALVAAAAAWLAVGAGAAGERVADLPGAGEFVGEMVRRHGFDRAGLEALFAEGRALPAVLAAIAKPAEARPWHEYRKIFLTPDRVAGGVAFWQAHRVSLREAGDRYGVAPEVIVAILGVETRYGRITGSHRVLDALATLAFSSSPRAGFFARELEEFLLLTREEGVPPLSLSGSYAGAMGIPQFMPSSYRRYAVDFDGDGGRDLWRNPVDAVGSVAHYLSAHGWESDRVVAVPATVGPTAPTELLAAGLKPSLSRVRLRAEGVEVDGPMPAGSLGALVQLETGEGHEYWVGLQNFYAITRYNRSPLYAMAVYQLSQEIKAAYGAPET